MTGDCSGAEEPPFGAVSSTHWGMGNSEKHGFSAADADWMPSEVGAVTLKEPA